MSNKEKKGRGRPLKHESEKRDQVIMVYLTKAEMKQIEERTAQERDRSTSAHLLRHYFS